MLSWPFREKFSCPILRLFEMKNIMITDIYWEKSVWTLHIHETHVRLQCHFLFMSVKKLNVCGDVGLTSGHTSLKVRPECSRARHFWKFIIFQDEPLEGDFHWGLMTSSFIIYSLGRSWRLAGGEPCKWWVQHVAFRTLCIVRDQSNLSQGSLHSAMQGLTTQCCGLVSLWVSLGSQGELFLWSIIRCCHIPHGLMMSPKERFKWWGSYEKWKGMGYYYRTVLSTILGDERTFHKILLDS